MPIDWSSVAEHYPTMVSTAFLEELVPSLSPVSQTVAGLTRSKLELADAATQIELLQAYLGEQAAAVLGVDAALPPTAELGDFGFDSLMGLELRNRIEQDLSVSLPMIELIQGPRLSALAERVRAQLPTAGTPVQAAAAGDPLGLLNKVDQLSSDELDALLDDLLSEGGSATGQPDLNKALTQADGATLIFPTTRP